MQQTDPPPASGGKRRSRVRICCEPPKSRLRYLANAQVVLGYVSTPESLLFFCLGFLNIQFASSYPSKIRVPVRLVLASFSGSI